MSSGITNSKILSHLDRVVGDHRPITADVFLDNYCNNNCGYCTYKRWELSADAYSMPFEDFKKYATRLIDLGVVGIILSGGGEPTIAKDFLQITAWMEDQGIKYGINTNFNKLVECHPEYLKVSLDAWDEESYYQKRGVTAYSLVRDNIRRYAEEYKDGKTKLGIQLIAKSVDDVYMFFDANKDLPVDYIVIRPVESTDGCYYDTLPYNRYTKPDAIMRAIFVVQQEDDRVVSNFKWNLIGDRFDKCVGQWAQIAINERGEVMYCCHKPYQIIGHIMDDDILEKKAKAMTDMKMCDVPCRLTSTNKLITQIYTEQLNKEFI